MTQEATNSIKLIQRPIIKHTLEIVGAKVTERIDSLNIANQLATEDTIKTLKEMRADLNKESKEFENQRKEIKDAVLSPYNDFEATYKAQIIEKYKNADDLLKSKINDFEMKLKTEKRENLISYFTEICQVEQLEWLTFDKLGIDVTLSVSEKKYKEQINAFIISVKDDISLIESDTYSVEILVEYKSTLKASQAIQLVRQRKDKEKQEAERLRNERTNQRTAKLRSLSFVYHDLTRTHNWVNDESVMISYSDIENLSNEDWLKKYAELKSKAKVQEDIKPEILKAPIIEQPKQEPIKEAAKEEIFEAKFSVNGTYSQLKSLGEFLKVNNYNYQNIQ